jgi:nucleoside 2-deoxyribosyltransferase
VTRNWTKPAHFKQGLIDQQVSVLASMQQAQVMVLMLTPTSGAFGGNAGEMMQLGYAVGNGIPVFILDEVHHSAAAGDFIAAHRGAAAGVLVAAPLAEGRAQVFASQEALLVQLKLFHAPL